MAFVPGDLVKVVAASVVAVAVHKAYPVIEPWPAAPTAGRRPWGSQSGDGEPRPSRRRRPSRGRRSNCGTSPTSTVTAWCSTDSLGHPDRAAGHRRERVGQEHVARLLNGLVGAVGRHCAGRRAGPPSGREAVRRRVGFVFQDPSGDRHLTARRTWRSGRTTRAWPRRPRDGVDEASSATACRGHRDHLFCVPSRRRRRSRRRSPGCWSCSSMYRVRRADDAVRFGQYPAGVLGLDVMEQDVDSSPTTSTCSTPSTASWCSRGPRVADGRRARRCPGTSRGWADAVAVRAGQQPCALGARRAEARRLAALGVAPPHPRLDLVAGALVLVLATGLLGARLPAWMMTSQVRPVYLAGRATRLPPAGDRPARRRGRGAPIADAGGRRRRGHRDHPGDRPGRGHRMADVAAAGVRCARPGSAWSSR